MRNLARFLSLIFVVSLSSAAFAATEIPRIVTIDSSTNVDQHTSIGLDNGGHIAISYFDMDLQGLKLWVDDGAGSGIAGDGLANGSEVRTIDSTGVVGYYSSLALDSSGHLAISYYDPTNTDLKLWVDDGAGGGTAGDASATTGEIRIIDSAGNVGQSSSLAVNSSGHLAASYYDVTNADLKLWIDDGAGGGTAGDGIATSGEIRIVDSAGDTGRYTSLAVDSGGHLAVSFLDYSNSDLKLWIDDGTGGGTADDGLANGDEIRTIDSAGSVGYYTSLALDSSGHLAISYNDTTNTSLKLWVDDGNGGGTAGDKLATSGETRTIDNTGSVGAYTSLALDSSGHLAVSYRDSTNSDLKLWVDNGTGGGTAGDGIANGSEVRTADNGTSVGQYSSLILDSSGNLAISYLNAGDRSLMLARIASYDARTIDNTGNTGHYSSIAADNSGHLVVSYCDVENGYLKLWVDDGAGGGTAGDGIPTTGEIRTIDSSGNVGGYTSLAVDNNGHLAVSYYDDTNQDLKLWVDDGAGGGTAGDGLATSGEIRTIDNTGSYIGEFNSLTVDNNGHLAVSYSDTGDFNLRLWLDDGFGGGTAGDGIANGSEIRSIETTGNVGYHSSIAVDGSGHLAISYMEALSLDLKLWIDDGASGGTAGDGIANGSEIRTIDSTDDVGRYTSIAVDSSGHLAVSYYDNTNKGLKLWLDDGAGGGTAGDGIANGSEIRTIDNTGDVGKGTSLAVDSSGHLAISYYDETAGDLKLWVDDGAVGGIAGDGLATSGEIRTLDSTGSVGYETSLAVDSNGHLAISYLDVTYTGVKLVTATRISELGILGNAQAITNGDTTPSTADNTDFGSQTVPSGTISKSFNIQNSGLGLLELPAVRVTLSGTNAADFSLTTQPNFYSAPSATTSFTIAFDPSAAGTRTALVTVRSNDTDENPYTFTIQGTGEEQPEMDVLGNSVSIANGNTTPSTADFTDFSSVNIGSSHSHTFTVANSGGATLNLDGTPKVSISGSSAFNVTSQPATTVAASGETTFVIQFAPTTSGSLSATVSIANDDSNEDPYTFAIQGTGSDAVDTDGDGIPDSIDTDDDNDSTSDTQEATDGTDPLNSDSVIEHANGEYCMDWNGFLGGLSQIFELRNAGPTAVQVQVDMHALDGSVTDTVNVSLDVSQQRDIIVNSLNGFAESTYGLICATVTSGAADALDAQFSMYKLNETSFNFAYSSQYTPGRTGAQYLNYNHFFPTFDDAEYSNLAESYVQISNEGATAAGGELVFYDAEGTELNRQTVSVPGKGRLDVATHTIGQNTVGMVAWVPAATDTAFHVQLSRYYYNADHELQGAVTMTAKRGSGAKLAAPFTTGSKVTVLELSNTLNSAVNVNVSLYDSTGTAAADQPGSIHIPAKGARHVIVNNYLTTGTGNAQIEADQEGAIVVNTMEYGYTSELGFGFASSGEANAGFGSNDRVSYNNFLGGCTLRLVSLSATEQSAALSMTRYDGTALPITSSVTVPGNGVVELDVCGFETQSAYGEVLVTPSATQVLTGDIVRSNQDRSAEFRLSLIGR